MSEQLKSSRKKKQAEFDRRAREIERAALACLEPGTDTLRSRERNAAKKVEHVTDLTDAFLLAIAKADRKCAESLRAVVLPALAKWELSLDEEVYYPGDLRSRPR